MRLSGERKMLERDLIHDCTCNKRIGIEDCKLHCIVFNKEIQSERMAREWIVVIFY